MKNNQNSLSYKTAIIVYIPSLVLQIAFFVYQAKNKILSIWNIIATIMLVGIFINAFRMMFNEKREKSKVQKISDPDIVTGGSTIDHSKPQKRSKKVIAVFSVITIVLFGLSALFFNIHSKKANGLEVVNSKVVSQWGETTITTEETDDGITQTEEDYIEVVVEYEYNGEKKSATITSKTTNKIYVDELKIYVDNTGKFVNDYGRILVWKIEAIIFLVSAIIFLLITIFALGIEFVAGTIFFLVGSALFFVIGSPFIENILFNDISCFLACFVNISIYMFLCGLLNLVLSKINPKKQELDSNQNSTQTISNNQQSEHFEISETPKQTEITKVSPTQITCKACGSNMSPTDNFCQYCGTKKD